MNGSMPAQSQQKLQGWRSLGETVYCIIQALDVDGKSTSSSRTTEDQGHGQTTEGFLLMPTYELGRPLGQNG